ncbi:biotin/lipoyl-binding protein [Candidatus Gracilibacteria bacterium]|nr:biotin/lipoyl-binding protein [Candidatus Gracilibacteria bacterium]
MTDTTASRRRGLNRWWLMGGISVIITAIIAAIALTAGPTQPTTAEVTTVRVERDAVIATVSGSGTIEADQILAVPFQTSGKVVEVLVEQGMTVQADQPLAQLDTQELELQVAQAEANLESALARLEQEQQGNSTPQDIAAQAAGVANARANLEKTRSGNVTGADMASAEAALRSAQAQLDALLSGPDAENVTQAQLGSTRRARNWSRSGTACRWPKRLPNLMCKRQRTSCATRKPSIARSIGTTVRLKSASTICRRVTAIGKSKHNGLFKTPKKPCASRNCGSKRHKPAKGRGYSRRRPMSPMPSRGCALPRKGPAVRTSFRPKRRSRSAGPICKGCAVVAPPPTSPQRRPRSNSRSQTWRS